MKKMTNWKKMMGATLAVATMVTVGLVGQANAATITVQQGNTLSGIAKQYGTTVPAIKYTNNLTSNEIATGKKLNMPFPYKVTKGDSLWYLAKRYHTTVAAIKHVNGLKSSLIYAGQVITIPVGKHASAAHAAPVAKVAPVVKAAPVAHVSSFVPQTKRAAAPVAPTAPTVAGMTYSKQLNMVATAYGPSDIMWQFGGLTYTGTKIHQGVIAVDPNVIPLGSKVFISGYNTPLLPAGGFVATAEDIGSAIKGNRVDIYLNGTSVQVNQFGMQNVKMYILK